MDKGERDAAIDSVITVLVAVIEEAHELVVAAWPSTTSDAHERLEQIISAGHEFTALSSAKSDSASCGKDRGQGQGNRMTGIAAD